MNHELVRVALQRFSTAIGGRLTRRVKPTLRAQANVTPRGGELNVVFCRQILANPDQVTCLCCDSFGGQHLRLLVDRQNPFADLPRDAYVYLLFCGSSGCKRRVSELGDALALPSDDEEAVAEKKAN